MKFTKLNIGDIVATSGTRAFRKLTTKEAPLPIWNGTDLTGTTWTIKSGWTAEAGYGEFDVNGKQCVLTGVAVRFNYYSLCVGYAVANSVGTPYTSANSLCWNGGLETTVYGSITDTTKELEFSFTGGADATNPRLIDWLLQNAKLTSHQLDLVGTWVFNDTITQFPVFDNTVADTYTDNSDSSVPMFCNLARYVKLEVAYRKNSATDSLRQLAMYNRTISNLGGETVFLGATAMTGVGRPFYYYESNTYLQDDTWSATAYNELTFLDTSAFTNWSGVYVGEKLLAWLRANAIKKVAGLYDANNHLVASWDTLVNNYKLSLSGHYNYNDQLKDTSGPYYILKTYSELSTGTKLVIDDSVTRIGDYVFYRCSSLKEVIIPESVTSLGHYSFASCTALTKVIIPGSVQTVSDGMFRDCTSLKDVTIGDGFRYLRNYMFSDCSSLPSIVLPDSVTTIGKGALSSCTSLKEVTIPVSVKEIRLSAFGSTGLKDVYYKGTKEQWAAINIEEYNEKLLNATIHYNYTG